MKRFNYLVLFVVLLFTCSVANQQTMSLTAFVDAKLTAFVPGVYPEKVWQLVGDFGNLDWAFNQTTTIVSGADNQPGSGK